MNPFAIKNTSVSILVHFTHQSGDSGMADLINHALLETQCALAVMLMLILILVPALCGFFFWLVFPNSCLIICLISIYRLKITLGSIFCHGNGAQNANASPDGNITITITITIIIQNIQEKIC